MSVETREMWHLSAMPITIFERRADGYGPLAVLDVKPTNVRPRSLDYPITIKVVEGPGAPEWLRVLVLPMDYESKPLRTPDFEMVWTQPVKMVPGMETTTVAEPSTLGVWVDEADS